MVMKSIEGVQFLTISRSSSSSTASALNTADKAGPSIDAALNLGIASGTVSRRRRYLTPTTERRPTSSSYELLLLHCNRLQSSALLQAATHRPNGTPPSP